MRQLALTLSAVATLAACTVPYNEAPILSVGDAEKLVAHAPGEVLYRFSATAVVFLPDAQKVAVSGYAFTRENWRTDVVLTNARLGWVCRATMFAQSDKSGKGNMECATKDGAPLFRGDVDVAEENYNYTRSSAQIAAIDINGDNVDIVLAWNLHDHPAPKDVAALKK